MYMNGQQYANSKLHTLLSDDGNAGACGRLHRQHMLATQDAHKILGAGQPHTYAPLLPRRKGHTVSEVLRDVADSQLALLAVQLHLYDVTSSKPETRCGAWVTKVRKGMRSIRGQRESSERVMYVVLRVGTKRKKQTKRLL